MSPVERQMAGAGLGERVGWSPPDSAMARRESVLSRYGTVDRLVLEGLRRGFDTSRLLAAIETAHVSDFELMGHPSLHSSLLCLHAMAAHLIDDAPPTIVSEQPIWQLAEEILDDVEASHAHYAGIVALIEQLAALRPKEE